MDHTWRTHELHFDGFAEQHLGQEWLLTNGQGGYAMGTAAAVNTRRYHGLLVAATQPPVGRVLALNQVWDQLVIERAEGDNTLEQTVDLASLAFRGNIFAPSGCFMLTTFERGLSVRWTYQWGDLNIQRELLLHHHAQAITLRYHVAGLEKIGARATLRLAPMVTLRDFHSMCYEREEDRFDVQSKDDTLRLTREGYTLTCRATGATFEPNPHWWNNIFYPGDHARGQEDAEDHFIPGALCIPVARDGDTFFTATLGSKPAAPQPEAIERAKHLEPIKQAIEPEKHGEYATLFAIASDDFVVERTVGDETLSTILAGYPWFADWGRDTFISLPGLLLETGRHDEARKVLRAFARCIRCGLVPNRFDDYADSPDAAHYNTVDASLWFIHAAIEYVRVTDDKKSWDDFLRDAAASVVDAYLEGTHADGHTSRGRALIIADADGLITAGHWHSQLTWMDAACGETVFTPRQGKAVEINALWYNALCGLAERIPKDKRYAQLATKVKRSFINTFWNETRCALDDHVFTDEHGRLQRDSAIRPNQIFAVSLPNSPLDQYQQQAVVELVREKLLVPMGLRTLAPNDPMYHPHYRGHQYNRDKAYHQGTTWPWLIGPYAEAVLRANEFSAQSKTQAKHAIAPLLGQMSRCDKGSYSFGQLHEIYEADPEENAQPVGCIAQAWSIAELLRVSRMIERGQ